MRKMVSNTETRKIIHVDMDCFYAAIEMRDDPKLQNKPIAVGGSSDRRGVLCTCNYEARKFGVRSAMPTAKAYQLCPDLIVIKPNFEKYKHASDIIREIFSKHTPLIEPLSLDEAFLDVTGTEECFGSATWLAQKIRQEIFKETKLNASAGIAPNKFLAKIASDWRKPNNQFTIPPEAIANFMLDLPVAKIFGVGKVTLKKLQTMGIETCGDLQQSQLYELIRQFGVFGEKLFELAKGIDHRPVNPERQRKSLSVEHTYAEDLPSLQTCLKQLPSLISELNSRIENKNLTGIKGIFVKLKFNDFNQTTVDSVHDTLSETLLAELLTKAFMRQEKPVRLIGVGIRLKTETEQQLDFEF